ncbi:MAG: FtsQ-type POTRA domain-containing protein [Chlorobiaceae bacterium]|nr:FtsQ-type POTRA domain-containing protein [Chlorobiaceae bacterium]NTV26118.1 FtsQ-type POTRA domain-containing protein [Chlorobiaceae bacterium]
MPLSTDDITREAGASAQDEGQEMSGTGSRTGKAGRILRSPAAIATLLLLLMGTVTALAWYASVWKREVKVSRVAIGGVSLLSRQKLEKSLSPLVGRKLAEVREEEIRRPLVPEPYIRELQIVRELNGTIRVTVSERQPFAMTVFQGRPMVIDTEGMLLPDTGVSGRYHRLPVIYGIDRAVPVRGGIWRMHSDDIRVLQSIISAFAGSGYAGLMLREIHLAQGNQSWFMVSGSPIRFILGNDGNFKEKLKKFEIFWQKVIAKKGFDCYESVDLRFRERVFAKEPQIAGVSPVPSAPASAATDSLPVQKTLPR